MTTEDQDRTLVELFSRDGITNCIADQLDGEDLFVLDEPSGRLWRINADGEYVAPNGEAVEEMSHLDGDWDFPSEFQLDEERRVGAATAVVTVEEVRDHLNGESRVVVFHFRREDVQTMELVEFLGQLGRTFDDYRLRLTNAAPAWQS